MLEIDRRVFLKFGIAAAAGVTTGELLPPVLTPLIKSLKSATGHPVGNAVLLNEKQEACLRATDPQKCLQNYKVPIASKIMRTTVNPFIEEVMFRAYPSCELSSSEYRSDPWTDVIHGTGGLGMTRRELVVGGLSSIAFGLAHNFTSSTTIDSKTIPAPQIIIGTVLWYLQRKFGFVSNTIAHAWINFRNL